MVGSLRSGSGLGNVWHQLLKGSYAQAPCCCWHTTSPYLSPSPSTRSPRPLPPGPNALDACCSSKDPSTDRKACWAWLSSGDCSTVGDQYRSACCQVRALLLSVIYCKAP